jgi:hypothetical protein
MTSSIEGVRVDCSLSKVSRPKASRCGGFAAVAADRGRGFDDRSGDQNRSFAAAASNKGSAKPSRCISWKSLNAYKDLLLYHQ